MNLTSAKIGYQPCSKCNLCYCINLLELKATFKIKRLEINSYLKNETITFNRSLNGGSLQIQDMKETICYELKLCPAQRARVMLLL